MRHEVSVLSALYVLKFGGNAIRGREDMLRLSKEIAQMVSGGSKVILIHGGGPEISEEMERRGLTPRKVCGIRVTDERSLEVADIVLRRLNSEMTDCLRECGVNAVGMPGYMCSVCTRKPPMTVCEDGMEQVVDPGLVGEVSDVDPTCLNDLLAVNAVPVIYPIGKDADGNMLNANADTMCAGIASHIGCTEMVAITDVPGILTDVSDPSSKIDSLNLARVDELIADGTISGGMIPKVEACRQALLAGVDRVRMVNGKDQHSIVADIVSGGNHGTVITK